MPFRRRDAFSLLASAALLGSGVGWTGGVAFAQESEPQTLDKLVDFILRPTQEEPPDEDIWTWENEPGPSALETPVGPPLLGPEEGEPIGPALAGPPPEPVREGRIRPRREREAEPFAPVGVNLGSFVIRPSIEIGGVATDNSGGSSDKTGAVGLVVAPEVSVRSESDRYSFDATGRGEVVKYDDDEFDEETAEVRARLRYDLTSATALQAEAGYQRFLEGFSDPDTPAAAAERPGVDVLSGSLGVEHEIGRLTTRFTGFVEDETHEEVTLAGGGVASRAELDNTEYGIRARTGYATSATLRPFVEAAVGRRDFDRDRDDSGFARSSVWGELLGGLVIDRGEKLSGEISIGYRREDLEDGRLEDLNVALANASILWSPRRLTEVRLDLVTETSPTSEAGASADIVYAGTLSVTQSFNPRLTGEVGVGLSRTDRVGDDYRDLTFTGFAGLTYAFNRVASISARYVYRNTDRNEPGGDYDSHEVGVRLRLQR